MGGDEAFMTSRERPEAPGQVFAGVAHLLDQALVFQDAQNGERSGRSQGISAESRAVTPWRQDAFQRAATQHRANRNATCEPLCQAHCIRHHAVVLEPEELSGATDAGLDLVGQKERAALVTECAECRQEALGSGSDAAFSLNRFHQDARDIGSHRGFHRGEISESNVSDPRQGAKTFAVLGLPGDRECAQRATVERVLERDDAVAILLALHVERPARELEHALHRLGSGVAEERAIHAGQLAEALRELDVRTVVEVVGEVDHLRGLLGDGGEQPGVRVTQRVDRDATVHVEVALARDIPQLGAATVADHDRGLLVVGIQVRRAGLTELALSGHCGPWLPHVAERANRQGNPGGYSDYYSSVMA
jgi:hypothetical protein